MATPWHFLTGEYPPDHGGVSDHTEQLARALARAGEEVHVWVPGGGAQTKELGVRVHRLPEGFRPSGLDSLTEQSLRLKGPKRWFIQYVPQGFGLRGANLPFVNWVSQRPREDAVWVLFHEVAMAWGSPKESLLAAMQYVMAGTLGVRLDRAFVSIPAWADRLPGKIAGKAIWLPVPSNLPVTRPALAGAALRKSLGLADHCWLGHFGTYSPWLRETLTGLLPPLLTEDGTRAVLLLGRGGDVFARALQARHPALADRICAPGELPGPETSARLAACDVLLQPFPDGASSRRTSLMASLALGMPVVSNLGHLSEPLWTASGALVLAPSPELTSLQTAARELLGHPDRWAVLGKAAAALYESTFSLERVVRTLQEQTL